MLANNTSNGYTVELVNQLEKLELIIQYKPKGTANKMIRKPIAGRNVNQCRRRRQMTFSYDFACIKESIPIS